MLSKIQIRNFKSIQSLTLSPKRVNLFIGKPSSGKSNILEALAFLSKTRFPYDQFLRMDSWEDLFYDRDLERKIEIPVDGLYMELEYQNGEFFYYMGRSPRQESVRPMITAANAGDEFPFRVQIYDLHSKVIDLNSMHNIFFYKFKSPLQFKEKQTDILNPPFGDNLPQIVSTRGELKKMISNILADYDLKLGISPKENTIKVMKEVDGVIYDYPFLTISDTLQRSVFYITAIYTHKNSILLLEESEANVFPFYNKYLGEKIAIDTNQYFLATHNSQFLFSILQKIEPTDLNIYITYYEDYQTKVLPIPQEKLSEVFDIGEDFFLNLETFRESV